MEPIRWQVEEFESIDSTNTWLKAAAADGAPEGRVARADFQTAGRGRLDRKWEAPVRSALLVSILLRPPLTDENRYVATALVALSARAALVRLSGVRPHLKWPNDLVVDDLKIAGILSEFVPSTNGPGAVIVGLGCNLSAHPDGVASTDVLSLSGVGLDPRSVLDVLLEEVERRRGEIETKEGRARLREELRDAMSTLGRIVRVERPRDTITGLATDVDDNGRLLVEGPEGLVAVSVGDIVHLRLEEEQ